MEPARPPDASKLQAANPPHQMHRSLRLTHRHAAHTQALSRNGIFRIHPRQRDDHRELKGPLPRCLGTFVLLYRPVACRRVERSTRIDCSREVAR